MTHRILRDRNGRLGLLFMGLVLLLALSGLIFGADPNRIDIPQRLAAPSFAHWLGTDNLGRDLTARISAGTRSALTLALLIVAASAFLGAVIGTAAGLFGRWFDWTVTAVFDTLSAFPALILAFSLVALYGTGRQTFVILAILIFMPQFGRLARSRAQTLRHQSFVEAERLLGVHPLVIVLRHILPNIAGPLIVLAGMNIPVVITFEAGLSFLGLGVQPPASSLGTLIKDGFIYMSESWWPTIGAAGTLALATLGSTLLAETFRDILDPKAAGRA
jgi:peptide/nickel transport system permease protein